ncbi:MAG: TVP38/TMEM64 family protein [Alphaproteobacteria bacterium]
MKALLKVMLTLALVFASTFIILNATGIMTVEKIQLFLELAKSANPNFVAIIICSLLFADLFIAVPTLTVMILGGYFLGAFYGAVAAITGLFFAGTCGYGLSAKYGDKLVNALIKDQDKRDDAVRTFQNHGAIVILLSRAVPILPEVSACMAGMTRMPFAKFIMLWLISTIPYAIIASYAGAISTLENPKPAIITAIFLTAFFWSGWFVFRKFNRISKNKH